jgi:hypothetical protein
MGKRAAAKPQQHKNTSSTTLYLRCSTSLFSAAAPAPRPGAALAHPLPPLHARRRYPTLNTTATSHVGSFRSLPATAQRRGIYVHSDLPDDLGIQYQTYRTNQPFAGNEHMTLHPGLGHTSCEPFDLDDGWYRGLRGLAGELTYTAVIKRWSIATHHEFPPAVRSPPVLTRKRQKGGGVKSTRPCGQESMVYTRAGGSGWRSRRYWTACTRGRNPLNSPHDNSMPIPIQGANETEPGGAECPPPPPQVQQAVQTMLLCHARERNILRTLPQHVVLHILKRVDWCWFENPEREAAEAAALEAAEAAEAAAAQVSYLSLHLSHCVSQPPSRTLSLTVSQEAAGEASGEGSSARLRTRSRRNTVEVEFW